MSVTPVTMSLFCRLAEKEAGLVLNDSKAYLIEHRLAPIAAEKGMTLDQLAQAAQKDSSLARVCVEALLTYESFWFRDTKPFDAIRELMRQAQGEFKVLSLACSTGQEPYSIAMLAADEIGLGRLKLLACDISDTALARAREGMYSQAEVARGLPAPLLAKWFRRSGARWQISDALRMAVQFRRADLRQAVPPAVGGWDLVLCRNVLIYMDTETREKAVDGIARQIRPGGHLVLGGGEPAPDPTVYKGEVMCGMRVFTRL